MLTLEIIDIVQMLVVASRDVAKSANKINNINVFPVPDVDTGSNLATTLSGIKKVVRNNSSNNELIDMILDSLMNSSCGNSGIMMTAYLSGFLSCFKNKDKITSAILKKAFRLGAARAREAVENPKSGTMLDVADKYSEEFTKTESFERAQVATIVSLADTEKKMTILSKNHVVDAGALGFCIFIFGFTKKITGLKFDITKIDASPIKNASKKNIGSNFYEVIFTAIGSQFSTHDIRELFHPLGDSLDIISIEEKIKVHIHTNEPDLVSDTAKLIGQIEKIQTVDMRKEIANH